MKLRKNIFDNYFFLNFSNLLKNFFLPPFFFNLIKKLFKKKRPKKYFQFWKGEELKIDYSIQNDSIKNIDRILTRNSLSREAGKFQNNQIIKFKNITNYEKIQFGVNAEKFIQDLSFFSNKIEILKIKGQMPSNRWVEIQLETNKIINNEILIKFDGQGRLFLSNLIKINNLTKLKKEKNTKKNIILLLVDSLMPRHLEKNSKYNFNTPYIDKFFKNSISFDNVYSQGDYTLPTVSSIITGLYPNQHGVHNPYEYQRKIPNSAITLAEILKKNDFINYAHSTGGRFLPSYNQHRGFDFFKFTETHTQKGAAIEIIKDTVEFIETFKKNRFFTLLHFNEVHPAFGEHSFFTETNSKNNRYISPGRANFHNKYNKSNNTQEEMHNYEMNFLKRLDFNLGYLFSCLESNELIDDTNIILTSDHGRGHYTDKDFILKKNLTKIPLKIKNGSKSENINEVIEGNLDLFNTILNLSGSKFPNVSEGRNLMELDSLNKKNFAITESPFINFYEIAIRDLNWLFIYKCKREIKADEINLDNEIYSGLFKIKNGSEDYAINYKDQYIEVYKRFYYILENHLKLKKYY